MQSFVRSNVHLFLFTFLAFFVVAVGGGGSGGGSVVIQTSYAYLIHTTELCMKSLMRAPSYTLAQCFTFADANSENNENYASFSISNGIHACGPSSFSLDEVQLIIRFSNNQTHKTAARYKTAIDLIIATKLLFHPNIAVH